MIEILLDDIVIEEDWRPKFGTLEADQVLILLIKKHGVLTPISVTGYGTWKIIDGRRRVAAARFLKMTTIPAVVVKMRDIKTLEITPSSVTRVQTAPYEYAQALKKMRDRDPTLTINRQAQKLGKTSQWILERLSLLKIKDPNIRRAINDGRICLSNAFALAKLPRSEHLEWRDRALTMDPNVFISMVTTRCKEIGARGYTQAPVVKPKPQRIIRTGWDNVTENGRPAYLRGDVLIYWTDKCWAIHHPVLTVLGNMSFDDVERAMEICEENLRGL